MGGRGPTQYKFPRVDLAFEDTGKNRCKELDNRTDFTEDELHNIVLWEIAKDEWNGSKKNDQKRNGTGFQHIYTPSKGGKHSLPYFRMAVNQ